MHLSGLLCVSVAINIYNKSTYSSFSEGRHEQYLDLVIQHSEHVAWTRKVLIMFPKPFK